LSSAADPESPIQALTIQQILDMGGQWNRSRSEAEAQYDRGHLPAHGFVQNVGEPLAALFTSTHL
jgi:hypothetical protein